MMLHPSAQLIPEHHAMSQHTDPTLDSEIDDDSRTVCEDLDGSDAYSYEVRSGVQSMIEVSDTHHMRQDMESPADRLERTLEELRVVFVRSVEESHADLHAACRHEQDKYLTVREYILITRHKETKATFRQKLQELQAQAQFRDSQEIMRQRHAAQGLARSFLPRMLRTSQCKR
jgi:predicted nuclease with TOPRIM domain